MIRYVVKGNWDNIEKFLKKSNRLDLRRQLDKYGRAGVEALSNATPVDTGKTASSWDYEIEDGNGQVSIVWTNSNVNQHVNIAIIIQYGHGTGTGGYVQGIDYINPAMKPVFDELADAVWKEVTSS